MQDSRSFSGLDHGCIGRRMALGALGFGLLALATAGLALVYPDKAGFAGYALLGGIGAVAALLLYAVVAARRVQDSRGQAGGRSRRPRQCGVGDHRAGRRGGGLQSRLSPDAGTKDGDSPAPPELALGGRTVQRGALSPGARRREGRAREESFQVMPGLELVAAVRP